MTAYDESFYDSDEWQEEREEVLQYWNGLCERCGCPTESPHVHHPYMEVLCPECHADHHGNDEILNYQKEYPKCKRCGKECSWKQINGKWKLVDDNNDYHICKDRKKEVDEINKSINEKIEERKKEQQERLF